MSIIALVLGLVGFAAIVGGLALAWPPLALVAGGLFALRVAVALDAPKE